MMHPSCPLLKEKLSHLEENFSFVQSLLEKYFEQSSTQIRRNVITEINNLEIAIGEFEREFIPLRESFALNTVLKPTKKEYDIKAPPLPEYITGEIIKKLKLLGMELRYVPPLNLDILSSPTEILKTLKKQYDGLYDPATNIKTVEPTGAMEEVFWEDIQKGKIKYPKLTGEWIAIETLYKPNGIDIEPKTYEDTRLIELLDIERTNVHIKDILQAIERKQDTILKIAGLLGKAKLELPTAIQWNAAANRSAFDTPFPWGTTLNAEYVIDGYDISGDELTIGSSAYNGPGATMWVKDDEETINGFRLVLTLS